MALSSLARSPTLRQAWHWTKYLEDSTDYILIGIYSFILPMVFRQNWRVVAHAALSNAILHDDDYDNVLVIMMIMMMMMVHK